MGSEISKISKKCSKILKFIEIKSVLKSRESHLILMAKIFSRKICLVEEIQNFDEKSKKCRFLENFNIFEHPRNF